jgi:surface polysaccharide O-acyltransferase-like enzyme
MVLFVTFIFGFITIETTMAQSQQGSPFEGKWTQEYEIQRISVMVVLIFSGNNYEYQTITGLGIEIAKGTFVYSSSASVIIFTPTHKRESDRWIVDESSHFQGLFSYSLNGNKLRIGEGTGAFNLTKSR